MLSLLPVLITLVASFSCTLTQIVLTQSNPVLKKPGESTKLTCAVTGFDVNSYYMGWIQQKPGKSLEWLVSYYRAGSTDYYSPTIQGRFTASKDSSNFYLQMNNLKAEDTAIYYCARTGTYGFDYWGQGTLVTVSSASPAAPTLFPLIPSPDERSEKAIIGCLAKNFLPDSITFSWENKNNVSDSAITTKTFPSILTSGTYTASSQASVPYDEWVNMEPFYCKAKHPSGDRVEKVVKCDSSLPIPLQPEMSVRAPPIEAFFGSYLNATITCSVVNLPSDKYTLQWLRMGQVLDSGFTTSGPEKDGRGYRITSELIVTKTDWLSGISFTCAVNGKDFNDTLRINRQSFCEGGIPCNSDVHVETIPPSYADIFQTSSAKLTCRIANVPLEQDLSALNVTWTKESGQTHLTTVLGKPQDQVNGLTYIDATATVCATDWNNYEKFTCNVNFPGLLPEPIDKTLVKRKYAIQSSPSVYVLPPTSEELALRETATVTCLVKGFSPEDIFLQWLHNDHPVDPSSFYTSEPKEEPKTKGKYFIYSILYISESDWSHGDHYTCVVGHEMLPMNSTQKTVDKNTGKPTVVNVSLVLSDTANTCN